MSPLDHIQSREPCEEAASPLLPFERHAFTLSRFLQESDFGTRLPNAFEVGEPLILAAGLTHVSIITKGLEIRMDSAPTSARRVVGLPHLRLPLS